MFALILDSVGIGLGVFMGFGLLCRVVEFMLAVGWLILLDCCNNKRTLHVLSFMLLLCALFFG